MLPNTETTLQPTAVEFGGRLSERVSDEGAIRTPGGPDGSGKLAQDDIRILPGARVVTEQEGMAGPGILIEGVELGDHAGPQGIEVNVAHEFEQVGLVLDEDGLEAALEKVADTAMAGVERGGVTAEQALHGTGEGCRAGAQQEVEVGSHQCPGIDREARDGSDFGEPIEEVGAISIGGEDGAAVDAASDHVMERIKGIQAWAAWHTCPYMSCQPYYNPTLRYHDPRRGCSDYALRPAYPSSKTGRISVLVTSSSTTLPTGTPGRSRRGRDSPSFRTISSHFPI